MDYDQAGSDRTEPVFAFATDNVARAMGLPPLRQVRLPPGDAEIRLWLGFGLGAPHVLLRLTTKSGATRGEYVHWFHMPIQLAREPGLVEFLNDMRRAARPHGCRVMRPGTAEWRDGHYGEADPLGDPVFACAVGFGPGEPDWARVASELDSLGVRDLPDPRTLGDRHITLDGTSLEVEVLEGDRYHAYTYRFPGARPEREAELAGAIMRGVRDLAPDRSYRLGSQPHLRIGALDAPEAEVFGSIVAVRADAAGNIFVLDGMAREVRWFDGKGVFRGRAGREGAGPGELRAPGAMAVGSDGLVHVLDPPNLKIATFRAGPEGLAHVSDARIPPAYDLCLLGPRRFVLRPSADGFLHELDGAGRVIRSFGEPASASREHAAALPPDLRADLDYRGHLHCDESAERVLYVSERLPIVDAYSADGELVWRTALRDFGQVRWNRTARGGIGMAPDPATGTAHTGKSIARDWNHVYVTLHEGSPVDPDGRFELRVLRAEDGREVRRVEVDIVITDHSRGRFFGHGSTPFPHVSVY